MTSSNKQRRGELKVRRAARKAKIAARVRNDPFSLRRAAGLPAGAAPVNATLLAPDASYGSPEFVARGHYLDRPFTCCDCGIQETWTATQQKWWYEIAKGGVWTTATRCRPCRRRERERAAAHKRRSDEGRIARLARQRPKSDS